MNLLIAGLFFAFGAVPPMESVQELLARLNPAQKQQFAMASKAFESQRYTDSLALYKELLTQVEGDAILSKFAAEAALNSGDSSFALSVVKPIATANPDDWQAAGLLTRICAESGDVPCRDFGIAHMLDLHHRGITPTGMQQYIIERFKVEDNILIIKTSLEPWGPYKVYDLGQVLDKQGRIFLRISLESSDGDQVQFAQDHPKEAGRGLRAFSLDSYRETGLNSNGQRTQMHATYKMFAGEPSYEIVRKMFVEIAAGKARPISSRANLIVP